MRNLTHCLLRSLALAIPFFGMSASSSGQEAMPETVKHLYCQEMDMRISDEFDTYLEWDTKWTKRRTQGDTTQISIETDKDDPNLKYLCLKAYGATLKGSGITTMNPSKYGFYTAKWRMKGITPHVKTIWHPAIWACCLNFGDNPRGDEVPYQRMELDPMEAWGNATWGSHFITWTDKSSRPYHLYGPTSTFPVSPEWETFGMEYTPDYISVWRLVNNEWKFCRSVPFSDQRNSASKANYRHRQNVYWILSNFYIRNSAQHDDSEFDVDYFRYYPYLYDESMQTNGINYAKVEGAENEVNVIAKTGGYKGKITIPAEIVHNGVTYKVTGIESEAFRDNAELTEVVLPDNLKFIGFKAFYKSGVVNNSPEGLVYNGNYLIGYNGAFPTSVSVKEGTTMMADGVFGNWNKLTRAELPESLTKISYGAFEGCTNLDTLTMSKNLTTIERLAFKDCKKLKELPLFEKLEYIGERAFDGCYALEKVFLSGKINYIGYQAFIACKVLSHVFMSSTVPPVMTTAFEDAWFPATAQLNIPYNCKSAYLNNPYWNKFTMILDPVDVVNKSKQDAKEVVNNLHAHSPLFEKTKYIGHLLVDDQAVYEKALHDIDALSSMDLNELETQENAIIDSYKEFLVANKSTVENGKYYVIESTLFFDDPNVKIYENGNRPAWKTFAYDTPTTMWNFEIDDSGQFKVKSVNSNRYVGNFKWGSSSIMQQSATNAVKFELEEKATVDVFRFKGILTTGGIVTLTAGLSATGYPNKTHTSGNAITSKNGNYANQWRVRQVDAVDVMIDSWRYASGCYPFAVDLSDKGEVKVFLAIGLNDNNVLLKEYTDKVLPANTPVLFFSEKPRKISLPITTETAPVIEGNILKGVLNMVQVPVGNDVVCYALSYNKDTDETHFEKVVDNKLYTMVSSNQAYLSFPVSENPGSETLTLTQHLNPAEAIEAYKLEATKQIEAIHKSAGYSDKKYVGALSVDDAEIYNSTLKAISEIAAQDLETAQQEIKQTVKVYTDFISTNRIHPEQGKYYVLESAGFFENPHIRIHEYFAGPRWAVLDYDDASALWALEQLEGSSFYLRSINTQKYVRLTSSSIGATVNTAEEGTKFTLVPTDVSCAFNLTSNNGNETIYFSACDNESVPQKSSTDCGYPFVRSFAGDAPNKWRLREVSAMEVPIDEAKYVTRNFPFAVSLSDLGNAKIFTVAQQNRVSATLQEYTGTVLPANTPVIVFSDTPCTVKLPITEASAPAVENNLLIGTLNMHPAYDTEGAVYILSVDNTGTKAGFYRLNTEAKKNRIPCNRAYMAIPNEDSSAPAMLSLSFVDVTGINDVDLVSDVQNIWYTLSGVRVNKPTKGIYVNGTGKIVLFK